MSKRKAQFINNRTGVDGLIAYYNFNSNTNDSAGSYNGTPTNITYDTGKSGDAAEFNGSSSLISIADDDIFSFTDGNDLPFSISMYAYFHNTNEMMLINKIGASAEREWFINCFSTKIDFKIYNQDGGTSNFIQIVRSFTRVINTWYHIVVTYDGSGDALGLKAYIDGVSTGSGGESGTYVKKANFTKPVVIGRFNDLGILHMDGLIDGLGIWDKELSQTEVTNIYNIQNGGDELV